METLLLVTTLTINPVLPDRDRFPPREMAKQAMEFNRAYRLHVQDRQMMELHNFWYWQEVLEETDYLYHCHDWLHAAQNGEGRDETYWIISLQRLKELIGNDAYNAGVMPPNVPVHRFSY